MLASLVVIVSFSEAHCDLRTTRDVHTVNKCLQSTQVKLCPFISNLNCILDKKKILFFFFVLSCTCVVAFSIVFFLHSEIALKCMQLNGFFNLCLFFHDCTKSICTNLVRNHAIYTIEQNLHRNYYSRFPD